MLSDVHWSGGQPYLLYYDDNRTRNADETTWEGHRISIQGMTFDEAGKPTFEKLHNLNIADFDPEFSQGSNFCLNSSVVHKNRIYIAASYSATEAGQWGPRSAIFAFDLEKKYWSKAVRQNPDLTFDFTELSLKDRIIGGLTLDSGEYILLVEDDTLKGYADTTPYHLDDWENSETVKTASDASWNARLGNGDSGMVEVALNGKQEAFYSQGSNILSPAFNPQVVVTNKFWKEALELENFSRRLYKFLPETTTRHKSTMIHIPEDNSRMGGLDPFAGGQQVSLDEAKRMMRSPLFLLTAPIDFVRGILKDLSRLTERDPRYDEVPLKVDLKNSYCSFGRRGDNIIVLLPVFVTWHWQVIVVILVPNSPIKALQ